MCHKVYIEGLFIPLENPKPWKNPDAPLKERERRDLLSELRSANYNYDSERATEIWKEIDEELWFDYERIDPPEGEDLNQEGLQWIRITEVDHDGYDRLENLEGERMALLYPNCD